MTNIQRFRLLLLSFFTACGIVGYIGCTISYKFMDFIRLTKPYCGYFAIFYFFVTSVYAIYVHDQKTNTKKQK